VYSIGVHFFAFVIVIYILYDINIHMSFCVFLKINVIYTLINLTKVRRYCSESLLICRILIKILKSGL
jgi:cell shape-determining protein MreD